MKRMLVSIAALLAMTVANVCWAQADAPKSPPVSGEKFPWPEANQAASAARVPNAKGSLAIRAVQGTPDGPPIGSVPVEIELQHQGMIVDTIKSQLDEHGVLVLNDLPVAFAVQPIVRVQYQSLTYQISGDMLDASHPTQRLDVTCYEPTLEKPAWTVRMMHVMVAETGNGVQVTQVVVIDNPADRTWMGQPRGKSKPVTTAFTLPTGAKDVTLGRGFHKWCCSTLSDNILMNHLPLMPQTTEMIFNYTLPVRNGQVSLDITAPAPVEHLMVLVPDSMRTDSFKNVELGGTEAMGESVVRYYMASNLNQGQQANIVLAGLRNTGPASVATGAENVAKIIAAIGGGMIIILAITLILLKGGARRTAELL